MRTHASGWLLAALVPGLLVACDGRDAAATAAGDPTPTATERAVGDAAPAAEPVDAETAAIVAAFPAIPQIVVPEIIGVTPAQRALEASMQGLLDPIDGVTIAPARCEAGTLLRDAGLTSVDDQGNLTRNGDQGIFRINADGSGTANYEGGLISVNADGSGTINGSAEGGADPAIIRVEADGSGTYNGPAGLIRLDGQGGGTWNGDSGLVTNNGDGSGTWNGPHGLVRIENDGSGTWNGPLGLVRNLGNGTGTVGTPAREVRMPPLPRVPPAGRFPPLKKFAAPGAPCGVLVSLSERVLFDFDKSVLRANATRVLDALAGALAKLPAAGIEIGGHTDSKGSDAYNQALSERRAQAVAAALRERGAAGDASARGYGESRPVAPNAIDGRDNPGGRQLNRRVEVFIRN